MPTYEYECRKCGHRFDKFQSIMADPVKTCPKCRGKVARVVSGGAGIIFKGSGFYKTDNRSKKPAASAQNQPASEPKAADSGKSPSPKAKKSKKGSTPAA